MDNHDASRAWGICRASSIKSVESCNTQRDMIAETCKRLTLPDPTILEEPPSTSGKIPFVRRPQGSYLMRVLRRDDVLVVVRVDRLGRSMTDVFETVQTLCNRGVRVMILRGWGGQVIDLGRATDRLFLMILAWMGETERNLISERTRDGLQFRRDNGLSTGKSLFTYIQAFDQNGQEILRGEYNKLLGHHLRNLPDRLWLDQIIELLALTKIGIRGNALYDYCEERAFVNRAGKAWWKGGIYINPKGKPYRNVIQTLLKKVRRMALLGTLPEDYNDRVLAITGDTPAVLAPKFKRKPRLPAASINGRADWTLEDWQNEFAAGCRPPHQET